MIEKEKRLEVGFQKQNQEIIESINKEYGEGTIATLGESKFKDYPTLPTGSIILDREVGGGYPLGKIVEIYGDMQWIGLVLSFKLIKSVNRFSLS